MVSNFHEGNLALWRTSFFKYYGGYFCISNMLWLTQKLNCLQSSALGLPALSLDLELDCMFSFRVGQSEHWTIKLSAIVAYSSNIIPLEKLTCDGVDFDCLVVCCLGLNSNCLWPDIKLKFPQILLFYPPYHLDILDCCFRYFHG